MFDVKNQTIMDVKMKIKNNNYEYTNLSAKAPE